MTYKTSNLSHIYLVKSGMVPIENNEDRINFFFLIIFLIFSFL